jgi:cell division protein FtsL
MSAGRGRWLMVAALWMAVLVAAAGAVYTKHRARTTFIELERLVAERDRLQVEWGRLQLEQSAWSTHAFVERVAGTRLKMNIPPPTGVQILQP